MGLIVTGGIGFLTWDDIYTKKYHFRQYCMQSKVILLTSLFLIFVPAAFFFFRDFAGMPVKERTLCAVFQSDGKTTSDVCLSVSYSENRRI